MAEGIVSYAQNFEDVMLWRALGHVQAGLYVDIGAQSASQDSVSMAFHEKGWRGVHVEPVPAYAQELREGRPGDIVIEAMVGARRGTQKFFAVPGTGLSTSQEDLAKDYSHDGRQVVHTVVPVITLDDVFDQISGEVHWLKIDVEGAEEEVIRGWMGSRRPWIVLVESTRPMTQIQSHDHWENDLVAKGYEFAYFDGLNRFYVHLSQAELKQSFLTGPNVFDGFTLSGTSTSTFSTHLQRQLVNARKDAERLSMEGERLNVETARLHEIVERLKSEVARFESELELARASAMAQLAELNLHLDAAREELQRAGKREQKLAAALNTSHKREQLSMQERIAALERLVQVQEEFGQRQDHLQSNLFEARAQNHVLAANLQEIKNSTSWKITAPARSLVIGMRVLYSRCAQLVTRRNRSASLTDVRVRPSLMSKVKLKLRPIAVQATRWLLRRPTLWRWARPVLRHPRIASPVKEFMHNAGLISMASIETSPVAAFAESTMLSRRAQVLAARIGLDIKPQK